ncbi:ABC transporter ATP-binding protein, partial [Nostoc sp. NMS4]|uniref:ABC transporter ATP-binding protein n=1 Tax=Nostoc sp. NMS4 TaxID=2815390 RepID=UPI0025D60EDF
ISLGHFVMTLTLSSMAYAELEPISNLAELFARRYSSMLRFHEFLQEPTAPDSASLLEESNQTESPYKFTGKVELSHVSFGYDANRQVLQDINLLIEPYQTVALVGRSGSGKSTLVKLLLRYFEPQEGQILIDGQDIRTLNVGKYRRRLAIVHQEVDVFNGTILDNLTYGRTDATLEQVKEACRIARVDEVVQHLPQGYYTIVGERGVRLSGGQRQRLGIARALLVEPDVLIFDEATSSLDYESERAIQLAMRSIQGTCTTIVIAHRLSTVREADKIVVLEQGKIVEVGSHDELLRQEGIYRRLHSLQETGELLS